MRHAACVLLMTRKCLVRMCSHISEKVAIRVSILVQFRVTDPATAIQTVENFEDRLYSDVQLAARRSLATMSLEDILTERNRLSEDILADVKEVAASYGVSIRRADVKDLVFPGNLQEIMNRVLAAQRNSEAQLVEARTKCTVATCGTGSDAVAGSEREGQSVYRRWWKNASILMATGERGMSIILMILLAVGD